MWAIDASLMWTSVAGLAVVEAAPVTQEWAPGSRVSSSIRHDQANIARPKRICWNLKLGCALVTCPLLFARGSPEDLPFGVFCYGRRTIMRHLALLVLLLVAVNGSARAGVVAPTVPSRSGGISSIELIQEKRKSETITERVKRAWKDLVGYKFEVSCPIVIELSHTTCTETGKDRADARAKCISRNPFCYVTDASR
jgi:hypothetical protein